MRLNSDMDQCFKQKQDQMTIINPHPYKLLSPFHSPLPHGGCIIYMYNISTFKLLSKRLEF